jgi:hypothetical protein
LVCNSNLIKFVIQTSFINLFFYVMETKQPNLESFDESQSLQVIREMIQVSQKKLKNDGILFILWGWTMFYVSIGGFIERKIVLTFEIHKMLVVTGIVLGLSALVFSIYYILKQRKKVQTYIGISLRYIWFSMFICLVLINLIQFNVLHKIIFELQHPIFMVIIAFAIVSTGGILRHKLITIGGVVFGLMALLSSYLTLPDQLLIEAIVWIIAFVIPGHILYAKRKS